MDPLRPDEFAEFFRALHGFSPFPWQRRLLLRVLSGQGWPECIDLPTGSGKTACIDIALFALACQADLPAQQRTMPRRIFFVVDRRVIVDAAYDRSRAIMQKLIEGDERILVNVATRLRTLGGSDTPLACVQLRGGVYRDDHWIRSPVQPTVIASTVDQIGSRLLYRGYGLRSGYVTPIHTGLSANDALIILDEAHCANPFRQTLAALNKYRQWTRPKSEQDRLQSPFAHTILSATPPVEMEDVFRVDVDDRFDPTLRTRLQAAKPATLLEVPKAKGAKALEHLAKALVVEVRKLIATEPPRPIAVGIIVNRVETARRVYAELEHLASPGRHKQRLDLDRVLLIGRMRPIDRDAVVDQWLKRLSLSGRDSERALDKPVVVVATQTLEVGADLDFDALLSECAGLDALRQRFGRLNRSGLVVDARAVILARGDQIELDKDGNAKNPDPIYGHGLACTWQWLLEAQQVAALDFGNEAFTRLLPSDEQQRRRLLARMATPALNAPVLTPSHLDLLVQTCPRPAPDPDVSAFLHGPQRGVADVMVCWREDLPDRASLSMEQGSDPWVEALALCPPAAAECMPVPLGALRAWLWRQPSADLISDVEGQSTTESPDGRKPDASPFVRWFGPEDEQSRVGTDPMQLRPGDTVVLPLDERAGYAPDTLGHIPLPADGLYDRAEEAGFKAWRRAVLRLHPALLGHWCEGEALHFFEGFCSETEVPEDRAELTRHLALLAVGDATPAWLQEIAGILAEDKYLRVLQHPCGGWVLRGSTQRPTDVQAASGFTDEDSSSSATVAVDLCNHLDGVGRWAERFASNSGLPAAVAQDLVLAARLHDLGKADPRFQALLHGGNPWLARAADAPLAKSAHLPSSVKARREARQRSGYPPGGRHELLSVRLAEGSNAILDQAHDPELVLHLIASHHGRCRPFAPVVSDPDPVAVAFRFDGYQLQASSATYLERIDSGVAERFWRMVRRYGWWGIAWLEALMRLADWNRSEQEQCVVDPKTGANQTSEEASL